MLPKDIYIDLGTNNTLIYARKKGLLLNEPSLITSSSKKSQSQHSIGIQAKCMMGKTPDYIEVIHPLHGGVIHDFQRATEMLHRFLSDLGNEMVWSRSRILISLPFLVQKEERQLFEDVAFDLGANIVHLISEPVAGAIGAGLDIFKDEGQMVLDLGAGTSEAVVFYKGAVLTAEAIRVGGNDIDSEISQHLIAKYNFYIGEQTSEKVKIAVADLSPNPFQTRSIEVAGMNLTNGLPRKKIISSDMIQPVLTQNFSKIIKPIQDSLENCPKEIVSDIVKNGIILVGGNSLIKGLCPYLSEHLGIKVSTSPAPLMSVTIGGSRILDDNGLFDNISELVS